MKTGIRLFIAFFVIGQHIKAQTVDVINPVVPAVVDRENNVVTLLEIDSLDGGDILDYVNVSVEGLEAKAVDNVKLVYTGTMSPVASRTQSSVVREFIDNIGGGQAFNADPNFSMNIATVRSKKLGSVVLNACKRLARGKNSFYVSLKLRGSQIKNLAVPFVLRVNEVSLNGHTAILNRSGDDSHRLGVSVRSFGDDGVYVYRIPGLVTTRKGTLLAVYDIRYSSNMDLQNHVDVGLSRSADGGKTWERMRVIMDMGESGGLPQSQNGVGDPSILIDENTGRIFVAAAWTHGIGTHRAWGAVGQGFEPHETAQFLLVHSDDDGKTWSKPVNITKQIKQKEWYFTLQGPGRGICMENGTLVFPMQHIGEDRIPCAGIMYSTDHGETWATHAHAKTNTTESQVVELEDGKLMLNMRDNRRTGRAVYVTQDMGKTWTAHSSDGKLVEPVCMASLLKVNAQDNALNKDILLFSNPESTQKRDHITIKASLDGGLTWAEADKILLDAEEGWGYSCLTMIDNETVGILYESSVSQLLFQSVKLKDLIKSTR